VIQKKLDGRGEVLNRFIEFFCGLLATLFDKRVYESNRLPDPLDARRHPPNARSQ
jgi:hypothetical protein